MQNKNFKKNEAGGNQIISFRDPDNEESNNKNFGPKAVVSNSVRNSSENEFNDNN